MRAPLVAALGLLTVTTTVQAQVGPYRELTVQSCPYADKLFGPLGDEVVKEHGFYDKARNKSYFVNGVGDPKTPTVRMSTSFAGTGPVRDPAVRIMFFLFDREGAVFEELSRQGPVRGVFVVNDTATIYPRQIALERLETGAPTMTPSASALFGGDDLLKVVSAQKVDLRIGNQNYLFSAPYLREIRGLMRLAVCPQ